MGLPFAVPERPLAGQSSWVQTQDTRGSVPPPVEPSLVITRYCRRMRIAHLVPRGEYAWSGILSVIVNLSIALAERGHDVEVWLLTPGTTTHTRHTSNGCVWPASIAFRSHSVADGPWAAVARHSGVRVEVIHLHGAINRTNTAVSLRLDAPFLFSPHRGYDPISLRRSRIRKHLYALAFERGMLARASILVTSRRRSPCT